MIIKTFNNNNKVMTTNLIIVCILAFLLWYYFIKAKENESKNLQISNEICQLYTENQKLKKKNNFLQEYKNDISKTFKILNNELVVINEKVKNNPELKTNFTDQNIINSLFNNINTQSTDQEPQPSQIFQQEPQPSQIFQQEPQPSQIFQQEPQPSQIFQQEPQQNLTTQPISSIFNNIFNRFLTDDLNSSSVLPNSHMYLSIDSIPLSRSIRRNQNINTGQNTGQNTEQNTEQNTGQNTEQNTEQNTGQNTGQNTEQNTEQINILESIKEESEN